MSAISDLIGKSNPTILEIAIMQLWVSDPQFQKPANKAAAQLSALEKVAEAATSTLAEMNKLANDELCDNDGRGCSTSSHVAELIPALYAALAEYEKAKG